MLPAVDRSRHDLRLLQRAIHRLRLGLDSLSVPDVSLGVGAVGGLRRLGVAHRLDRQVARLVVLLLVEREDRQVHAAHGELHPRLHVLRRQVRHQHLPRLLIPEGSVQLRRLGHRLRAQLGDARGVRGRPPRLEALPRMLRLLLARLVLRGGRPRRRRERLRRLEQRVAQVERRALHLDALVGIRRRRLAVAAVGEERGAVVLDERGRRDLRHLGEERLVAARGLLERRRRPRGAVQAVGLRAERARLLDAEEVGEYRVHLCRLVDFPRGSCQHLQQVHLQALRAYLPPAVQPRELRHFLRVPCS
mmetsp:Transcript_10014/g.21269  ORF Transcript_10014/g.21269 Transcript_10014/m.21269 type:complete len:305 (+) Transcript_10014:830-1744(+)